MWNGCRGQEEDGKEDTDNRIRLAALAAYAAGGNVDPNYGYDPRFPAAQFSQATNSMLYQSQAVEALRRQEEMQLRQQALYSLQQQQQVLQQHELHELEYARLLQQQQLVEQQRREVLAAQQQKGIMERCETDIASLQHDGVGRYVADVHPVKEAYLEEQAPFEEFHQGRKLKGDQTSQANLESHPESQGDRSQPTPEPKKLAAQAIRGKPEAMAAAIAAAPIRNGTEEEEEAVATAVPVADDVVVEVDAQAEVAVAASLSTETPKKKAPKKRKATPSLKPKKKQPTPLVSSGPTVDDPVPPITEVEYENVIALMEQFCRVPLLAEFSRPVARLHPEVSIQVESASLYSKTFINSILLFHSSLVVSKVFQDCQSSY